jgi:acyl-[acyl-carrier-protein]-phospholipid O-acyltransferase / long-chain-fatty-acid--[acyl-carrier-protein] ligase
LEFELKAALLFIKKMSDLSKVTFFSGSQSWRMAASLRLRLWSKVRVLSRSLLQADRDLLLLSENLSYAGAVCLQAELKHPLTIVLCARPEEVGGWAKRCPAVSLHLAGDEDTQAAADLIVTARQKGQRVCFLRLGLSDNQVEEVVRKSRSLVVPCQVMDYERPDLRLWHPPLESRGWPHCQALGFGFPIKTAEFTGTAFRQSWDELNAQLVERHPAWQNHLGRACVAGLKKRQFQTLITDSFQGGRSLSGGMLLAVAWEFSLWIKQHVSEQRVGIVLPPGLGATIANLACLLADKTPVNLNFTLGRAANEAALRTAALQSIITAEMLVKKLEDFPWTEHRIDLSAVLKTFSKPQLLGRRLLVFFLGAEMLCERIGLPEQGGDEEAGLLFTSGSSGDPKGVVLSHKNILANVAQIEAVLPRDLIPSLMGCLPIFHSFGFTVTLWWPLISGPQVVTYISPLEVGKLIEAIEKYRVALLITTPTFLRSYLRKAKKEQLASLNMVVTGAEKLPPPLRQEFEEKFGIPVCEGYGMTETTPVIGVNVPAEGMLSLGGKPLLGKKDGTIGRPCPGVAIKVCQAGGEEEIPCNQSGVLWFKGANVFAGYLNDPTRSALVLKEGWYLSGDVGRLDEDGFLHIEGRLSRFSKIGGEMVPHGTVEQHLTEILKTGAEEEISAVVMGISDAQKGEALVALVTGAVDKERVRQGFAARGLPNLWMPKQFVPVAQIPLLASGKLDLKNCQKMVNDSLAKD